MKWHKFLDYLIILTGGDIVMFSTTRWNWWLLTPIRIINWFRLCKNRIEVMCEKEMLYLLTRSGPGTAKSSPLCNWSRILDLELKRSHKQYVDTDDAILLELRFFKQSINHLLKMNICYIQNCKNNTNMGINKIMLHILPTL